MARIPRAEALGYTLSPLWASARHGWSCALPLRAGFLNADSSTQEIVRTCERSPSLGMTEVGDRLTRRWSAALPRVKKVKIPTLFAKCAKKDGAPSS